MPSASQATYGLLGMLATRSWTSYELTQQVRRSLRYIWPASEAHLYREQKRLVELGWASVEDEATGQRTRKRYTITAAGRAALAAWLSTEPAEPQFHIEGVLRAFFGDHASSAELANTLQASGASSGEMLAELLGFVDEYLAEGGPLTMLESGTDGEFRGRQMYPERLHVVALSIDITTRLLEALQQFCDESALEVRNWRSTTDPSLTAATRARLEAVRDRNRQTAR